MFSWAIWKPVAPVVAIALVLAVVAAYIKGREDGAALEEAQALREERIANKVKDEALKASAEAIAGITVNNTTIRQTMEREIHEKPVYLDCRHTPDGMRAINAAINNQPFALGDRKLPGAYSTSR